MIEIAHHERVAETLRSVAAYPVPVARTCHLGNNGAYNWGWLALARNTRPVLDDHTTYGADRLCLPWTVLGDGGRVDAAYDIDGGEVVGLAGAHATDAAGAVASRHRSILNYGIPARHGGRPLAQHHHAANRELARHFNGSRPSFDALAIRGEPHALPGGPRGRSPVRRAPPDDRLGGSTRRAGASSSARSGPSGAGGRRPQRRRPPAGGRCSPARSRI